MPLTHHIGPATVVSQNQYGTVSLKFLHSSYTATTKELFFLKAYELFEIRQSLNATSTFYFVPIKTERRACQGLCPKGIIYMVRQMRIPEKGKSSIRASKDERKMNQIFAIQFFTLMLPLKMPLSLRITRGP